MSKKKRVDPIPEEFSSYEEAAEFWDIHNTTDYPEAFRTVEVVTEFRGRHYEIEVEEDVFRMLKAQARKKGVTISRLASGLLRSRLRMAKGSTTKGQLRITLPIECPCQTSANLMSNSRRDLDAFRELQDQCAALKEILVPEGIWDQFQRFAEEKKPVDEAHHTSILLNAFEQGFLSRITLPIHTFLLDDNTVRREVKKQYLSDLRETWFCEQNVLERHKKARSFLGRLSELIFAYWLISNSYKIKGLEATGAKCDVITVKSSGDTVSFELKYIGTEDLDFKLIVERLQGSRDIGWPNPYSAANYLLFQVFSAAKQVRDHTEAVSQKVAAILISEMTWCRFDIQLMDNWIDWSNPKFFHGKADERWVKFLAEQKQQNPKLEEELKPIIGELNGIRFMCMYADYEIKPIKEVTLR